MSMDRLLLVTLTLVAAAFSGCVMDEGAQDNETDGTDGGGTEDGSADEEEVVRMTDDSEFDPQDLTVATGTTVTWRNVGNLPHTVTSSDDGPLDSGEPGSANGYSFTFDEAGVYEYRCTVHSFEDGDGGYTGMVGTVTVEDV